MSEEIAAQFGCNRRRAACELERVRLEGRGRGVMNEDQPRGPIRATRSLLEHVDRACDAFEDAWRAGRRPRLEEYLVATSEHERPALLRELLAAELELRYAGGERPELGEYRTRFREYGKLIDLIFDAATAAHATAPSFEPGDTSAQNEADTEQWLPGIELLPEIEHGSEHHQLPPQRCPSGRDGTSSSARSPAAAWGRSSRGATSTWAATWLSRSCWRSTAASPRLVRRFVEEAQIGGQLQHPGIVPVYELGTFADARPYFTMKLVKGRRWRRCWTTRQDPAEDRPRFLAIFEQVCQTMAYAHARGVIHRDLKPSNVMVGAFGEVQVMDWGLAKVLARGGAADEAASPPEPEHECHPHGPERTRLPTRRRPAVVLGTPAYMAPEQASGELDRIDERADVFGLGAILCEILTGKPPYTGRTSEEVLRKAARGDLADALAGSTAAGPMPS